MSIETPPPGVRLGPRRLALPLGILIVGLAVVVDGLVVAPGRTWPNLLVDSFYFLSLSVSAIFFLATQRVTSARWSAALRRIPEAFMLAMPVAVLLVVPIAFGAAALYPWARPEAFAHAHAHDIGGRTQYLRVPFVAARMAIVLAVWTGFAWLFRRASLAQDRAPGASLRYHTRLNRYAAVFVVVFALSITIAAFDLLASLDPGWFTTMFAVYVFAGTFVQGIAAVTLATVALARSEPLRLYVSEEQLHDLGKLLFAFSTFWAYIWTCQYLLIWYGNIPEEVTHYAKRTNGGWVYLFGANFIINWIVPFFALMSVRAKRDLRRLATVAAIVLVGRWLDLYLLVMPSLWPAPHIGAIEILTAAGYGALIYLLFGFNLSRAPIVPLADPVLAADTPHHARRDAA